MSILQQRPSNSFFNLKLFVILFFVFHLIPPCEWFLFYSHSIPVDEIFFLSGPFLSYLLLFIVNLSLFILILKKYVVPCLEGGVDPLQQTQHKKMIDQVVHDVRSPVSAMKLLIEYELENVNGEIKTLLQDQIERIQNITNDLSRKNKEDGLQVKEYFLPCLIDAVVKEKKVSLKFRPEISLDYFYDEALFHDSYSKVNSSEFKRVLSNMINNAVDAADKDNLKISVTFNKERRWFKDYIKVIIEDNGKGIPKEIISKIFQEHYSYGKEGMKDAGDGLGLYHAKKSVERWGGYIQVSSVEGRGARFSLLLPKV